MSSEFGTIDLHRRGGVEITPIPPVHAKIYFHPYFIPVCIHYSTVSTLTQLTEYLLNSAVTKTYVNLAANQLTDAVGINKSQIQVSAFKKIADRFTFRCLKTGVRHKSQIELHSSGNSTRFFPDHCGVLRHLIPSPREPRNITFQFPSIPLGSRHPVPVQDSSWYIGQLDNEEGQGWVASSKACHRCTKCNRSTGQPSRTTVPIVKLFYSDAMVRAFMSSVKG